MLENITCGMIVICSVWGVVGIVYFLCLRLARPRRMQRGAVLVLLLPDGADDAVLRVSYTLARLSVCGDLAYTRIAAVCGESDETTKKALAGAFSREPHVVVCDKRDFISRCFPEEPLIGQGTV